ECAGQLEVRDIIAIKHDQRGEVVIWRRAQRALAVQREHTLAPLLAAPRAIFALTIEIVDLFFGHALELRAGIFRTAWLHFRDLPRRRHAAGPVLNRVADIIARSCRDCRYVPSAVPSAIGQQL